MKIDRAQQLARDNDYTIASIRRDPFEFKNSKENYHYSFTQPYLVQTLLVPDRGNDKDGENEYGWGGGKSGLSLNSIKKINKVVDFKYMGSAQFERGNLAESLNVLIKEQTTIQEISILGHSLYVWGLKEHELDFPGALEYLIVNNQFGRYKVTRENLSLDKKLLGEDDSFLGGWDIENHFIFFLKEKTLHDFIDVAMNLKTT